MLNRLRNESIDLLVTDPPYLVRSGGNRRPKGYYGGNSIGSNYNNDGKIVKHQLALSLWLPEAYRVLKSSADIYVMSDARNLHFTIHELKKAGFRFHNVLVWHKSNSGTPNRWYMKNLEFVLYFFKGQARRINNVGDNQLFSIPNVKGKSHPTEKPVELMSRLIANSSKPGQVVLDPFCGSGSTLIAAHSLKRKYIGYEIDLGFYQVSQSRLLTL